MRNTDVEKLVKIIMMLIFFSLFLRKQEISPALRDTHTNSQPSSLRLSCALSICFVGIKLKLLHPSWGAMSWKIQYSESTILYRLHNFLSIKNRWTWLRILTQSVIGLYSEPRSKSVGTAQIRYFATSLIESSEYDCQWIQFLQRINFTLFNYFELFSRSERL